MGEEEGEGKKEGREGGEGHAHCLLIQHPLVHIVKQC
jgi:hypothetical protein